MLKVSGGSLNTLGKQPKVVEVTCLLRSVGGGDGGKKKDSHLSHGGGDGSGEPGSAPGGDGWPPGGDGNDNEAGGVNQGRFNLMN